MQIGISSPAFALDDFETRLESITPHFSLWEILADLNMALPDIKDKLVELASSYDIEFAIHAPFNDLNIAAFNTTIRKLSLNTIKESMTVANELGMRTFSVHPGHYCPSGMYAPEKVFELSKSGVRELDKFARDLDIDVCLENMPIPNWTLCTEKDELMEYLEGTELKICFDIGHANINKQINEFLNVKERFGNIHIHDNNGDRDKHMVIGQGNIPFADFMPDIASSYSGNLIIEANDLDEGIESFNIIKKILNTKY